MGDFIRTKTLKVEIQENGIIRRADNGRILAHLSPDLNFEDLPPGQPEPEYGAFVLKRAKDGTPTKVQIGAQLYALIPPPIGKGKGRK